MAKGIAISLLNQRMCRSIVLKIKNHHTVKRAIVQSILGWPCVKQLEYMWDYKDIINIYIDWTWVLCLPHFFFITSLPQLLLCSLFAVTFLFCDSLELFTFLTNKLLLSFLLPSFCEWTMQRSMRFSVRIYVCHFINKELKHVSDHIYWKIYCPKSFLKEYMLVFFSLLFKAFVIFKKTLNKHFFSIFFWTGYIQSVVYL